MFCSLWLWTRSSLWTPTRWASNQTDMGWKWETRPYQSQHWCEDLMRFLTEIWSWSVVSPLPTHQCFPPLKQIVRADLKELRDLDLEGAPYGYTPFCDSRREMEGYRFWKTGYWASHLGHRKYHIRYTFLKAVKCNLAAEYVHNALPDVRPIQRTITVQSPPFHLFTLLSFFKENEGNHF